MSGECYWGRTTRPEKRTERLERSMTKKWNGWLATNERDTPSLVTRTTVAPAASVPLSLTLMTASWTMSSTAVPGVVVIRAKSALPAWNKSTTPMSCNELCAKETINQFPAPMVSSFFMNLTCATSCYVIRYHAHYLFYSISAKSNDFYQSKENDQYESLSSSFGFMSLHEPCHSTRMLTIVSSNFHFQVLPG